MTFWNEKCEVANIEWSSVSCLRNMWVDLVISLQKSTQQLLDRIKLFWVMVVTRFCIFIASESGSTSNSSLLITESGFTINVLAVAS